MLTLFYDMKGPITIDFFEKGAAVNSTSYSALFRQNPPYLLNDPRICIARERDERKRERERERERERVHIYIHAPKQS